VILLNRQDISGKEDKLKLIMVILKVFVIWMKTLKSCFSFFSLLSLPDLVLDTLVEAIGRSSVQSLLNLRLVCKEAKEWVDGKPQAVREKFYCKGQVRLALDVASIRLFNMWMSQASVTSLSLDPSRIGYGDLPQRRRMWGKFLSYWMPHLENLEIQREPAQNFLEREVNYDAARELIRKLLQSPRLKKVVFLGPFDWQLATPFPRSFHNITDLVIDGSLSNFVDMYEHSNRSQSDEGVKDFYTQLAQNDNLKSVALKSSSLSHIRGIKRFFKELIKRDRRDLRVQITVTDIFRFCDNTVESFVGLVKKAIDSKCAVNYHIIADSDYDNLNWLFTTMKNSPQEDKLSPEEYMHFTQQQLESLIDEISRDDPSVLDVQSLQGLKNLGMTNVDPESLKDVIFPRSLVTLGCGEGFPSVSNLPLTLTKLCLYKVECGLEELESSMTAIGVHCINLRELLIAYVCNDKTVKNASSPTIDGCGNSEVAPFRGNLITIFIHFIVIVYRQLLTEIHFIYSPQVANVEGVRFSWR